MEEQASQDQGGRDPSHLAQRPNLGGLPDTPVSRLPDSLPNPVANRLAGALCGRELQRVGRVSLFVSLPTHRNGGMSVMWSWRTPADRHTAPKIAEFSWISPVAGSATHLITYSLPTSLQHAHTSGPIVIFMGHRHHRQGNNIDPSPQWSGSIPLTCTHTRLGLALHLSIVYLAAASPARKLLPRSGRKVSIPPGRKIPLGSELLNPMTGQVCY